MPKKIDLMARAEMVRMRSNPPETPFMRWATKPRPLEKNPLSSWLQTQVSLQEVEQELKKPDIYVGPTMARKIASKARPITLKIDLDPEQWDTDAAYVEGITDDLMAMIDEAIKKGDEAEESA